MKMIIVYICVLCIHITNGLDCHGLLEYLHNIKMGVTKQNLDMQWNIVNCSSASIYIQNKIQHMGLTGNITFKLKPDVHIQLVLQSSKYNSQAFHKNIFIKNGLPVEVLTLQEVHKNVGLAQSVISKIKYTTITKI